MHAQLIVLTVYVMSDWQLIVTILYGQMFMTPVYCLYPLHEVRNPRLEFIRDPCQVNWCVTPVWRTGA